MQYAYRARDTLGNVVLGSIDATGEDDAALLLRRDGLHLLKLEEDTGGITLFARRIRKDEIVYLTGQLAIMVETGITLSTALGAIGEQAENPTLKRVLRKIKADVESGEDFSKALAAFPRLFDKTYVSLVRSSESTGNLGSVLDRIADYLRRELDMRGKVRAAMAYPAVMATLALGVSIFLLVYILPKFTPLLTRKGVEVPKPTAVMMAISAALTGYWYLWLVGVVSLIALFVFGRRHPLGKKIWDWCKINAPIVGPLLRKVVISRSIRTLGAMLNGGVSMLDALELCKAVSNNYYYEQLWATVADEITAGNQICDALSGNRLLPPTLVQMISAGEETGKIAFVLERVSNYYDSEVDNAVKAATSLIEPLLICVMGVVVGGIGMALMLPIFKLSQATG